MTMELTVEQRNVYGKTVFYPICQLSTALARIAKTKTLTTENLVILTNAGFDSEVKGCDSRIFK